MLLFRSRIASKLCRECSILLVSLLVVFSAHEVADAQPSVLTESSDTQHSIIPDTQLSNSLKIVKITSRLDRVTALVSLPTHPQDVLIVQGSGVIDVLSEGRLRRKNFLDIEDLVSEKNPESLFGITFSRHFPVTRFAYIGYVDRQGDTVISRVTVGEDARASEDTLRVEMKIVQSSQHQRTGALTFGSDDALYIATGDGGFDPPAESSAQNSQSLLGKILRISVGSDEYTIPTNNPYRDDNRFLPEIFAVGFRDPFQILTHQSLYVLDRGKAIADEINVVEARSNFGWPMVEGDNTTNPNTTLSPSHAQPLVSYSRDSGKCLGASTILERRDRRFLVYGDCGSGALFARELLKDAQTSQTIEIGSCKQPISALLVDRNGDLLIGTQLGEVYHATGILR